MVNLFHPSSWITKKVKTAAKRMFQAAVPSRLTSGWGILPEPPNYIVRASYRQLVARSREQWQNNPYIRRYADLLVSNVVGHDGIRCHPVVKLPNGQLDDQVNNAIYDAFMDFSYCGASDVAGIMSFPQLQRLSVKNWAIDGEIFIREYRNPKLPYGIAFQAIDPMYINVLKEENLPNGNYIMQGIEYNELGTPQAYYIYQPAPGDTYSTYENTATGEYLRVPADRMHHVFIPFAVNQKRGVPMTANCLQSLKLLDGYIEAGLVAARVGASTMGILHTTGGDDETLSDAKNSDGSLQFDAEPGVFRQLPDGVKLDTFKPEYPTNAFQPFIKTILRQIASGLGVSYTSLSNDIESVNYSSIRQDALQDRELYRVLSSTLIDRLIRPMYLHWLEVQLMRGVFRVGKTNKKTLLLDEFEKYAQVRYAPRAFQSIDPEKDAKADAAHVAQGLRSRSDVIRRELGQEPEAVFAEIASENAKLHELGLDYLLNIPTMVRETV